MLTGIQYFLNLQRVQSLTDEDDNNYIDFIGSWGPMILGHSNPIIVDAVKKQLELGTSYGAPTGIENNLAELIKIQVPSMEKLQNG